MLRCGRDRSVNGSDGVGGSHGTHQVGAGEEDRPSFVVNSGQRHPQLRRRLPPFRRPRTPSRLLHLLRQPRPPHLEASQESHGRQNPSSLARPLPPLHSRPPPPPPPPRRLRPLHRPPQPPRLLPLVQEWIYEGCTEIRDFDNAGE
ncbi:hypothetical protein LR48_Vigan04g087000 [Vigna angularis]|uniref:Uncharacterized protein n=1 Tax=Phaseolus angularis TaxID=3914 RepID=A0A0L9UDP6_PHAAN|nr:hypothetical protein LR48_Vigan04g087000 [Vigna angularis]